MILQWEGSQTSQFHKKTDDGMLLQKLQTIKKESHHVYHTF